MIFDLLWRLIRFLLSAPFIIVVFLLLPQRFYKKLSFPRWYMCWAALHDDVWDDDLETTKCKHCGRVYFNTGQYY